MGLPNASVLLICAFVALGALIFGMDGGYFSGVLAMDDFIRTFGSLQPSGEYGISSSRQSFMTSFPYLGQFLAALVGGYVGNLIGRRWGLFLMCMASVAGVFMQLFAKNVALLVAGRFFNYCAIGFATIFVPMYQAETAPSALRGVMITMYQFNVVLGSFVISIVDNFTAKINGPASWKIPIGVLLCLPVLILPGLPVIPESPRWLVKKAKLDKAKRALLVLHRGEELFDVDSELRVLCLSVRHQEELNLAGGTYLDCFRGTNLRRTAIACFIQIWQQFTGVSFIFNYATVFFTKVGVSEPFTITIITNLVNVVGTVISFFIVDKIGRRPLLLVGSVIMFVGHFSVGVCGVVSDHDPANHSAQIGVVVFTLIYVLGLASTWGPLGWVITSEISNNMVREKTQGLGSASNILFSWVVTFSLPYLLNDDKAGLGSKVGFIYAGLTLCGLVYVWFYVPETRGLSLEELDKLFEHKVPTRKFTSYRLQSDKARLAGGQNGEANKLDTEKTRTWELRNDGVAAFDRSRV
ncbi:general substrate transporter [Lipomyces orientalis]|uniref:General substrate transporter n=1 Tax=Lipomyces orientalis TaxID=1233043 RepID=A0ACC3TNL0_9ASCO